MLYNAGTLLDELGDREQAVHYLYQSLRRKSLEDAYNYLGVLLGQINKYREAVQVFDEALRYLERLISYITIVNNT